MTSIRLVLTSVALALGQTACAQAPAQLPTVPPAQGQPTPPLQNVPAAEPTSAPDRVAPNYEPRILRGNDQVVAPPKAVPPVQGPSASFNFEEAPIAEVVRTVLGDVLKSDYVLHPPLNGSVTLVTKNPMPADQAVFLLESALQANGLALMRDARGVYHVGRPDALRAIGGSVRMANSGAALPPGYGTVVIPLQYIGANEMANILRPMAQPEAIVRVDALRNLLVMAGTRTQAEGWMEIINMFDVDLLKGMSVGVFPLKYVSTKEVEAALRLVSGGLSGEGAPAAPQPAGRPGAPQAAAGSAAAQAQAQAVAALGPNNPLFGALRVMPIERLNSVLVVTPRAAYLEEARRWIEKLDQPGDGGAEAQLFIYSVQNVNARHLATVLSGIFGGLSGSGGTVANTGVAPGLPTATGLSGGGYPVGAGAVGLLGGAPGYGGGYGAGFGGGAFGSGFGGTFGNRGGVLQPSVSGAFSRPQQTGGLPGTAQPPVGATLGSIRVMADDLTNSVLVWSTRAEYERIEATLKRLDVRPTQVLIEASIVEVTLNDDLRYGLQWAFSDSRNTTNYTGTGVLSNSNLPGVMSLPLNGFSYTLRNSLGNVRAVLSALSTKTSVKVVASPSLMVLDNHLASIAVGTQTPIQSGTTSNLEGTVTTTNIQYKDTGVNLMVTPSVNAGNIVTMQIDQAVTDVGAQDDVTKQRSFLQRQLSSKVAVRSGESIVMGGLIQERGTTGKTGVPILHTIPLVGNLFGTTATDGARTELLVVITPRVVRSDIDIREVSEDLRDRLRGLHGMDLPAWTDVPAQGLPQISQPLAPQ